MEKKAVISYYVDTRRKREDGIYPIRLRVYNPVDRKKKLYQTEFNFTVKEFQSIWENVRPRTEYKSIRLKMTALENRANEAASKLSLFSFAKFEELLYRKGNAVADLFFYYDQAIKKYKQNNQFGTASNYELSLKSITTFLSSQGQKVSSNFSFSDIDPDWLTKYEYYMIEVKQRSRTTVSMYLRALRTIFNSAIFAGDFERESYPFGIKKYEIPSVKNVKKALSKSDLKTLFNSEPQTPEQAKAKDFWFFSYCSNGMNIKDILTLKYEDINDGKIQFYRAKTINTSKKNLKSITVLLDPFAVNVIEKYGNKDKNPKQFVFPFLNSEMNKEMQHSKIKNFTRFINQNLKILASANDLSESISTYWARHSFATQLIQRGGSIELAGDLLGHSHPSTTKGYFAGFEDDTKRELMEGLMKF